MIRIPAVISDYIASYNSFDIAGMMACMADDVHFVNRTGNEISVEAHGIEEFQRLAEQGIAIFQYRKQTISNIIACNGHVTLDIDYVAKVAADLPNGWRTGQTVQLRGVSIFTLKDGKIVDLVDMS